MTERSGNLAESRDAGEVVITRTFEAPPELVWTAWTSPERFQAWCGPKGFTSPFCRIDFRVGGSYHGCMRSPEGKEYWSTGVYLKIVLHREIVLTDSFADEKGNVVPAKDYGMKGDWPRELLVMLSFEEEGGGTKMTLRHLGVPAEVMEECEAGWNESFDKMEQGMESWRNPG